MISRESAFEYGRLCRAANQEWFELQKVSGTEFICAVEGGESLRPLVDAVGVFRGDKLVQMIRFTGGEVVVERVSRLDIAADFHEVLKHPVITPEMFGAVGVVEEEAAPKPADPIHNAIRKMK